MRKKGILILSLFIGVVLFAEGKNTLTVEVDSGKLIINKNIYGHFAEHLGRCIYDGIWVGPDSDIPNINGYRKDVFEALKALQIPVLRWPGGCFADTYRWRDGIGPKNERPKINNVFWGRVIEDNSFGTHEFLNFCEMLGCDPYVSVNVGSSSVREMIDWIEYMTSEDDIPMANLRRENGREDPWDIKFLGIGNESWGCGGDMTPEYYSDLLRNYSVYARVYGNKKFSRVGGGANSFDYEWTEVLMEKGRKSMDDLSVHYYTIAGEGWRNKSAATGFDEPLYFNGIKQGLRMDELITNHGAIMDKHDPRKRIGLLVDEWGIWTDKEPGSPDGFLYQQNSMRDALIASNSFDIFNKHCERVKMANIAQLVNVLQTMILTEDDKMVLTPTYHVFNMYKIFQNTTLLPSELVTENYIFDYDTIPALSTSISKSEDGTLNLAISNVNPHKEVELEVDLKGAEISEAVSATLLTAEKFNSHNTFDKPETVKPTEFKNFKISGKSSIKIKIPAISIVVLKLK